jgi:hypothetical protein
MVSETDGTMCSLDEALAIFLFKSKRGKRPWPWKVVFEIGPDIRISTTGYIRVLYIIQSLSITGALVIKISGVWDY